jgi:hypothetical protein
MSNRENQIILLDIQTNVYLFDYLELVSMRAKQCKLTGNFIIQRFQGLIFYISH